MQDLILCAPLDVSLLSFSLFSGFLYTKQWKKALEKSLWHYLSVEGRPQYFWNPGNDSGPDMLLRSVLHTWWSPFEGRIRVRPVKRGSNVHSAVDDELLIVDWRINRRKEEFNHFPIKTLPKVFLCMCLLQCSKFLLIKAETEVTSPSLSHLYFMNFQFCVFHLWRF